MKKIRIHCIWILLLALLSTQHLQAQHTIEVPHTYYTLAFDTVLKSPLISWYIQTTAHATSSVKIERKKVGAFHQDPFINPQWQIASNAEYRHNAWLARNELTDSTDYERYHIPIEELREFIKLYYPDIRLLF